MGLIKTAIMTGGGMYAANKIAKTVQQHNSTNSQNNSREGPYPQQDYYGPRPAPLQGPSRPRAALDENYSGAPADRDQQRDNYYSADDNNYDPRRDYYPRRDYSPRSGMRSAKPSSGFVFPAADDDGDEYPGRYIQAAEYPYQPARQQFDDPPSYSPQPQYVQPRPYRQQQQQQQQQMGPGGSSSSLRDMATGMAMDFVKNGGKDGKKDKKDKGSKGVDMINEFFK